MRAHALPASCLLWLICAVAVAAQTPDRPAAPPHSGGLYFGARHCVRVPARYDLVPITVELWVAPAALQPWAGRPGRQAGLVAYGTRDCVWDVRLQGHVENGILQRSWVVATINLPVGQLLLPALRELWSSVDITLDQWHHIAFTYDGRAAALCVDGQLDTTQVWDIPLRTVEGAFLSVGDDYPWTDEHLTGTISELRIWSVARTLEEIRRDIDRRLTGGEPGLAGYWPFDEGEGQVVRDASPAGHNGYLGTSPTPDDADPAWVHTAPQGGAGVPPVQPRLYRLTTFPGEHLNPQWSPDGKKIAFRSDRDGKFQIYVMNADGSNLTRLTTTPGDNMVPNWSPDGTQLAFHSNRDGNWEIYVMDADGSNQRRLAANPAEDSHPVWSPDGRRLAFHSNRDGDYDVYVMNADGTGVTALTRNQADDAWAAWSPDGRQIAFSSTAAGSWDIWVMNADGSGLTNLTQGAAPFPPGPHPVSRSLIFNWALRRDPAQPASNIVPTWSPDGSRIAFMSNRDGLYDIYLMNADGTGPMDLTQTDLCPEVAPSWSPDGSKIAFDLHGDICTMDVSAAQPGSAR